MKRKSICTVGILVCCLFFGQTSFLSAANTQKILLGAGLIVSGGLLSADGVNRSLCFGQGGCDRPGANAEIFVGLGIIGVGAFFVVKGIRQNSSHASEDQKIAVNQTLMIGAGPVKHGWAAAARIRW